MPAPTSFAGRSCCDVAGVDGTEQRADPEAHANAHEPEKTDVVSAVREALASSQAKELATSRADGAHTGFEIDIGM